MASNQSTDTRIRFPIEQKEQAAQRDPSTLLARGIYESLANLLESGIQGLPDKRDLDQHRSHSAILIDGDRGTGKSSVLVNLGIYMESKRPDLAKKVHILKPVDPTLLEETDDLFLNVIVAAIIRDPAVAEALSRTDSNAEEFHHQLQTLGNTLEALQQQRNKYGLDKLRAFMGSHDLNKQVHELFRQALKLINKDLLVLPIDDVDTSLNRAFENLEVVRRYLTSPYVQPIISGDLNLYHEVIRVDFHSKLTHNNKTPVNDVGIRANELATEYQRKLMPLHLRMKMPTVDDYISNKNIVLSNADNEYFSLPAFWQWIDALLNDRVNNSRSRRLEVKPKTVRALTQFIAPLKQVILHLHHYMSKHKVPLNSGWTLHRLMFIPSNVISTLEEFSREFHRAQSLKSRSQREAARDHAYNVFFEKSSIQAESDIAPWHEIIISSKKLLLSHLLHEQPDSAACLTLEADLHFNALRHTESLKLSQLFETRLFQPRQLGRDSLESFPEQRTPAHIDEWQNYLPYRYMSVSPSRDTHPYTLPEMGHAIHYRPLDNPTKEYQFLSDLLLHRSFITEVKRPYMIFSGRLFELVVASLVRDIQPHDLLELIDKPPYYSLPATQEQLNEFDSPSASQEKEYDDTLISLSENISLWRKEHHLDQHIVSSWVIFNALNSYFKASWTFNHPINPEQAPTSINPTTIPTAARIQFRNLWNTFACIEKGEIFGMAPVVNHHNISSAENFEQTLTYKQNIQGFMRSNPKLSFGADTRSYTFALASHPLRTLIDDLLSNVMPTSPFTKKKPKAPSEASQTITDLIKAHFNLADPIDDTINKIEYTQADLNEIFDACLKKGIDKSDIVANQHLNYLIHKLDQ